METSDEAFIQRQTLCIAGPEAGLAVHAGDAAFDERLSKHYQSAESNVNESLVDFKNELRSLSGEAFFTRLMEGMTNICHAQFGFVSKRILVDDDNAAVEMPAIGEVGSCLMGIALYFNDGKDIQGIHHDYKYFAWSAPCAYMKHDKVFLIPDGLNNFIPENPNQLPFDCSAYLGVPLFADGKCFAHFGMMWTDDGLSKKSGLSWSFLEMFLRSLEDIVTDRVIAGRGFSKPPQRIQNEANKAIPRSATPATQSLRPYARSLSHELRTPMQGVVGMLDVMYATVQEQIEGHSNNRTRTIFQNLKENIEIVQDSSKRAVEAADNVVQAYDLNMQIPDTPSNDVDSPASLPVSSYFDVKPNMGSGSTILHSNKRKSSHDPNWNFGHAVKRRDMKSSPCPDMHIGSPRSPTSRQTPSNRKSPKRRSSPLFTPDGPGALLSFPPPPVLTPSEVETTVSTPASLRQSLIRDVISVTIQESLRVGGRPDSAVSNPIDNGERIEVRTRSSNGHASQKIIEWTIHPDVPELISVDERDLSKLISAVFLNAVKFTENGDIKLHVRLSQSKRHVLVDVIDTGIGIPEAFQPELFKAFSQEDDSLTRTKEGLGLGLLVAKGLARRIGGDLTLVRSDIDGPNRGSEFQIKIPLEHGDTMSRASTPSHANVEASIPRSTPAIAIENEKAIKPEFKIPNGKESSPLEPVSPSRTNTPSMPAIAKLIASAERTKAAALRRTSLTPRMTPTHDNNSFDRQLGEKHPLTFLVAEDNKINRKLLVNMLNKLGYKNVYEAFDGKEAVRIVDELVKERQANESIAGGRRRNSSQFNKPVIDVVLMDLWMPEMDGYQATETIFDMFREATSSNKNKIGLPPTVLAVSADVTDAAIERATTAGMLGYMSKPYKLMDLYRLIMEFCVKA